MDEKVLLSLGLSAKELVIYKAVLNDGIGSPAALAKQTGIKRTTAYSLARGLTEKGLLTEDFTKRPHLFTVATPEEVTALIDSERKQNEEREQTLAAFAAELSKVKAKTSYPVPTVRFVEEEKIAAYIRSRTPEWDRSLLEYDGTWWGFLDHTWLEHHADWLDWYWPRADKRIQVKLLTNRAPIDIEVNKKFDRRQTKYYGEVTNFLSSFWIVGDYVIMVNTRTKPFYMVETHDKLMAHDLREVFKKQWESV